MKSPIPDVLSHALQLHGRKIDRDVQRDIHVVREEIERDVRDYLNHAFIIEARRLESRHICIGDGPAIAHDLQGKGQRRLRTRISSLTNLRCGHLVRRGARLTTKRCVSRQAVFAAIGVGDRHGNFLAEPRAELTAAESPKGVGSGWGRNDTLSVSANHRRWV